VLEYAKKKITALLTAWSTEELCGLCANRISCALSLVGRG
jgi:hypothetical protein